MRCLWGILLAAAVLSAGVEPRPRASDYPATAQTEAARFGAEYLVRSVSAQNQTFLVNDYLVVEVAVYPEGGRRFPLAAGHFTLRVNGKKTALLPQTPGMVAASLKYPDWERRTELVLGGGVGDTGVVFGRRDPVERFPGDPRPRQSRLPTPPRVPTAAPEAEKEPTPPPEELVIQAALPEGEIRGPVAGYLYFAYKEKPRKIRKLELLYSGPAGDCVLRLL